MHADSPMITPMRSAVRVCFGCWPMRPQYAATAVKTKAPVITAALIVCAYSQTAQRLKR